MNLRDLPYEIVLNICKYIPIKKLRLVCRLHRFANEDVNNIIYEIVKIHVIHGLGITMNTFYGDCQYYIYSFFYENSKTLDCIKKFSKFPFEQKIYSDFLEFNENIHNVMPDLLYIYYITKISQTYVWNNRIVIKLLHHNIYDNIFLFSMFWINFVSSNDYHHRHHSFIYKDEINPEIQYIYRLILTNKYYINYSILQHLFDNTYFPIKIIDQFKSISQPIYICEKFLVLQRLNGNPYQIHNYNLIKHCCCLYNKSMYFKLIREERDKIKQLVRISNPFSKGKTVKINSPIYENIISRLKRENYHGTFLDLQLEKKLLIDKYQRIFFE